MSRQGRNATVLVGGSGGAFGEYAYDDDPDDIDDGLTMPSLYFNKHDVSLSFFRDWKWLYMEQLFTDAITRTLLWAAPYRMLIACYIVISRLIVSPTMSYWRI